MAGGESVTFNEKINWNLTPISKEKINWNLTPISPSPAHADHPLKTRLFERAVKMPS
jgi:hypothetical protein